MFQVRLLLIKNHKNFIFFFITELQTRIIETSEMFVQHNDDDSIDSRIKTYETSGPNLVMETIMTPNVISSIDSTTNTMTSSDINEKLPPTTTEINQKIITKRELKEQIRPMKFETIENVMLTEPYEQSPPPELLSTRQIQMMTEPMNDDINITETIMEATTTSTSAAADTTHTSSSNNDNNRVIVTEQQLPEVVYTMTKTTTKKRFDVDRDWDPPMALPTPQPPSPISSSSQYYQSSSSRTTNIGRNRSSTERATSTASNKSTNTTVNPVYVELAYVPGHGKRGYCDEDFFRKIRARYYVFSGVTPSRQVLDALLNGVKTWLKIDDQNRSETKVTIVPTYESEAMARWYADHKEQLDSLGIEIVSAANRCWLSLDQIDLQSNNNTTNQSQQASNNLSSDDICFAYKIEF